MRESDLYPPVKDYLLGLGYAVHVEIFDADIIGVQSQRLTVVELKLSFGQSLFQQMLQRCQWADFVYGAIPQTVLPRRYSADTRRWTNSFRRYGFGLLSVGADQVRTIITAQQQPFGWYKKHQYRLKHLARRVPAQPHELAGIPSGSQLREQRRRREQSAI